MIAVNLGATAGFEPTTSPHIHLCFRTSVDRQQGALSIELRRVISKLPIN